jgi:alkanesulfonate monooxygenase SsuD/methylene tetrahydromethanopterin reductase-like flavin-dependent oxidoreductase (luciferase family)
LADVIGVYDVFRGNRDVALRGGVQVPVNDPSLLIPAMAHVTEHLGFAYTSSVPQCHPFTFARADLDARSPDEGQGRVEHRRIVSRELRP